MFEKLETEFNGNLENVSQIFDRNIKELLEETVENEREHFVKISANLKKMKDNS